MKNIFQILCAVAFATLGTESQAQSLNTTLLGHLPYSQELSEVRGASHNGREYALVGVYNGFSIVDVTNPASPTEVFFEAGVNSIWRDPFFHNGHAYCVNDGGGGMLIVDMNPLPSSTSLTSTLYTGSTYNISAVHNMFIESATNKAYLFGTNDIDGAIILDISDPMNPLELGVWNDHYIHDGFVRGDTLWAGCLEEGSFLVDVSVPSSPVVLSSWDTPSQFAHNIWPSDDNAYCYTTDEVVSGFIASYDMSDLQNVVEADRTRHPLTEGVIPHNSHFINDYVVSSHYRDGLTIHDVSDPTNMILTGYFDSSPMAGGGFNGAWGAWPYLPSGNLLISDIEEGLFIIGANYERAARIQGNVTEFGTVNSLNGVLIEVVGAGLNETTDLFGFYATGTEAAGTYEVTFAKGGYLPQTVSGVTLVNGQVEILDVALIPDTPFNLSGLVTEQGSGDPIEGATLQFVNPFFDIDLDSDASGNYIDNAFFAGQYEVTIGAWGYVGECVAIDLSATSTPPNFELAKGYHDDFTLDLGWESSGDASTGDWEMAEPIETTFESFIGNPGVDSDGDCGDMAFVTGNGGGSAGTDDVDDGIVILTSPMMDLTGYTNPFIHFDYWFFNDGSSVNPNDAYLVKMSNGTDVANLGSLPLTNNQWTPWNTEIASSIILTSSMQLIIEVEDADPGHLLEGGLDKFRVTEGTAINEQNERTTVSIYPNPANNFINVAVGKAGSLRVFDIAGKQIGNQKTLTKGVNRIQTPRTAGVYICEVTVNNERHVQRLLVQ
jgi:choice-of-anchor B domain-containing protein